MQGITYTINITDVNGVPTSSSFNAQDWSSEGFSKVPNAIQFNNQTGKTVYLTGGTNWYQFLGNSYNQITIAEGTSPVYTFIIINMVYPVNLNYTLSYTNDGSDSTGQDSPAFIITMTA